MVDVRALYVCVAKMRLNQQSTGHHHPQLAQSRYPHGKLKSDDSSSE
jgi:hypothetical protein